MVKLFFMVGESTITSPRMCVKVPPAFEDKTRRATVFVKNQAVILLAGYSVRPPGVGNTNVAEAFCRHQISAPALLPSPPVRFPLLSAAVETFSPVESGPGRHAQPQSQWAVPEMRSVPLVFALLRPHCRECVFGSPHVAPLRAPTLIDVQVLHTGGRSLAPPSNQRRSARDGGGTAAGHRRQQVEVWR